MNSSQEHRLLFVIYNRAQYRELLRLARVVLDSTASIPIFLFRKSYDLVERDIDSCLARGISVLPGIACRESTSAAWPKSPAFQLRRWIPRVAKEAAKFCLYYHRIRRTRVELRQLLNEQRIDLLVLPEDNVGYDTAQVIRAAHDLGVHSLVVPYTFCDALGPAEAYWDRPQHQYWFGFNWLAAWLYPQWVFRYKNRSLLRLSAPSVLSMEIAGIAPPSPWVMNSGHADCIAMESLYMFLEGLKRGFDPKQMAIVGATVDDILSAAMIRREQVRQDVSSQLGLNTKHRLIVTALPPNQLLAGRPDCEFMDYETLISSWIETLAAVDGFSCIICLHPRVDPAEYLHLERENVRIAEADTAEMIPIGDIFVASYSSTIRWAIACGIPTINYDVYRYSYGYYKTGGVLDVDSLDAFREAVADVAGDPEVYAKLMEGQQRCMSEWGVLDGKAKERMMDVIDRLVTR